MYDDVLGIAFGGTAGTGAVLAQTGGDVGPLLLLAWVLAFVGTMLLAGVARVKARNSR